MFSVKGNMVIVCLCVVFVDKALSKAQNRQRFTMEPQNTTAVLGSRLLLPCRVKDRSGIVQWTKNDFGLGDKRDLPDYERYKMIGNDEEEFSLEINPVTMEDESKFQCQVGFGVKGQPGIRSQYSWVTVVIPPRPPKILQGNLIIAPEGMELLLDCISGGGRPAAQLEWVDTEDEPVNGTVNKTIFSSGETFTVKSTLQMKLERHHHNTTIMCRAKSGSASTYLSTNVLFQVLYPPEVHLEITPSEWISEGSNVTFSCRAKGRPSDLKFEWMVEDKVIVGAVKPVMIIENVPRELDNAVVKCRVENAVGMSTGFEIIRVSYGPSFRSLPKSVAAEIGTEVTISCDAIGNPPPVVKWFHNNTEIGKSANLTLLIRENSGGIYTCKAHVPGFPEVNADYGILIKGNPIVVITEREDIDVDVLLKCVVFSIPPPPHIVWTYQGAIIEKDNQNYYIREKVLPNGIESILTFNKSDVNLYGAYNCSVATADGTFSAEKILEIHHDFTVEIGQIVGGVMIAAAVIISLCAFMFRKRFEKSDFSSSAVNEDATKSDSNSSRNETGALLPDSKNILPADPSPLNINYQKDSILSWDRKTNTRSADALTSAVGSEYLVTNGLYDYNRSFQPTNYSNIGVKYLEPRNTFRHFNTIESSPSFSLFQRRLSELERFPTTFRKYENTKFGTFFTEV